MATDGEVRVKEVSGDFELHNHRYRYLYHFLDLLIAIIGHIDCLRTGVDKLYFVQ